MLWKRQDPSVLLGVAPMTGGCRPFFKPLAAAIGFAVVFATPLAGAQRPGVGEWIDTWTASPQPIWDAEFPVPLNIPRALNQTVRQIAAVSIGGNRVRVALSSEYGSRPLVIGAAHIALAASGAAIALDNCLMVVVCSFRCISSNLRSSRSLGALLQRLNPRHLMCPNRS